MAECLRQGERRPIIDTTTRNDLFRGIEGAITVLYQSGIPIEITLLTNAIVETIGELYVLIPKNMCQEWCDCNPDTHNCHIQDDILNIITDAIPGCGANDE